MKNLFLSSLTFCMFLFVFTTVSQASQDKDYPKVKSFGMQWEVSGLKARHDYVVCINGYGGHQSNDVLKAMGQLWSPNGEGYCDFTRAMSNDEGKLSVVVNTALPAGPYRLKVLLKDPEGKWKVVWNADEIKFEIVK